MTKPQNEDAWNKLSDHYQKTRRISLTNYHYNAYGPGDNELQIIGDVQGLDVLEVGCGGGQNSIVLTRKGAKSVTGVDQSEEQLAYARALAEQEGADIRFIKSDMEDMSALPDSSFDLIVSSHAMNYAFDIDAVFQECARLLRSGGRLVTCMNHPQYIVVGEVIEYNKLSKLVNYYDGYRDIWDWKTHDGEKIATFECRSWRLEQIINGLIKVGLRIDRVAEPQAYSDEELKTLPPDAIPYVDIPTFNEGHIRAGQTIAVGLIVCASKV